MKHYILLSIVLTLFSSTLFAQRSSSPEKTSIGDLEIYAHSAGEIYFFTIFGDRQEKEMEKDDGSKVTWDYTSRQYKMSYEFEPVYMASFEGYMKWNFLTLDGSYKTNRFLKGGGTIEHDSEVASRLSDSDELSEILQFGIGIFNLHTSYRSVQFDFGKAHIIDVESGETVETTNINLRIQEADITYMLYDEWNLFAGYKYMDYTLPRIVYKMEDTNSSENDDYVYVDETKPQNVSTKSHLAGFGVLPTTHYIRDGWGIIYGGSFYIGGGFSRFTFDSDEVGGESETVESFMLTLLPKFHLGGCYRLVDGPFESKLRVVYEGNLIAYVGVDGFEDSDDDAGTVRYNFNSGDYYHGISFAIDFLF